MDILLMVVSSDAIIHKGFSTISGGWEWDFSGSNVKGGIGSI